MPIPRRSDRRSPCNKFHAVAPFITADVEHLVFIGRFSGGWIIVPAADPEGFVIRRDQLTAFNHARQALTRETEILRLRRWRQAA